MASEHPLRTLCCWLVFPVLMTCGIMGTLALINFGFPPIPAYTVVSLLFFLAVFGLEKLLPHRADWAVSDGEELHDLGHTLVASGIGSWTGEALTGIAFTALGVWAAGRVGHGFWPTQLPFWAQVLLVYLLADLGRYVQHRLMHRYALLWRFHALHHSVSRLSALKTSRSHLVERFLQPFFLFGLLFFLGAPPVVVFWYMMPNSLLGMIDHSNLDVRIGPLGYLINGPAEHRLHHSRDMVQGNRNFGSALVVWDMLFGTFENPRPHHSPARVGIENDPMPTGFVAQIIDPFLPARGEAGGDQLGSAEVA